MYKLTLKRYFDFVPKPKKISFEAQTIPKIKFKICLGERTQKLSQEHIEHLDKQKESPDKSKPRLLTLNNGGQINMKF